MRIAAFTDIHAQSDALRSALAAARRQGFDLLLILGDLLTYGVDPVGTLELVQEAAARDGAVLLAGNHDLLYRAGDPGEDYRTALPDWLRESIEWTAARVPDGAMDTFDWRPSWSEGPLFAAHANPYAFGDWRYIRTIEDAQDAAAALQARGHRFGLFGHVHRLRRFDGDAATVVTLASLGQPRDALDQEPCWAMVDLEGDTMTVTPHAVDFDRQAHMRAIRATGLSPATQERLCRFFA